MGVGLYVFVYVDDVDFVEVGGIVDQQLLVGGQNCIVGGVLGDCEFGGDLGDG